MDDKKSGEEDSKKWLEERMEGNREEVNRQLPAYSKISRLQLHGDEFEKTPTHKIKRYRYQLSPSASHRG